MEHQINNNDSGSKLGKLTVNEKKQIYSVNNFIILCALSNQYENFMLQLQYFLISF